MSSVPKNLLRDYESETAHLRSETVSALDYCAAIFDNFLFLCGVRGLHWSSVSYDYYCLSKDVNFVIPTIDIAFLNSQEKM